MIRTTCMAAALLALAIRPAEADWYGWQTLATDGAGLTLTFASAALEKQVGETPAILGMVLGVGTLALGAPIVHLVHGEELRASGSLAMRLGLPLLSGYVGEKLFPCHRVKAWDCFLWGDGATYGFLVGVGLTIAVDTIVLAREDDDTAAPRMLRLGGSF